ncbi:MAG: SEC-C domain-containing protein, partial [Lachnospiraceae bacterium]|nr:SEC-C domain-containing protein [Lachnospiraceae bacterium]
GSGRKYKKCCGRAN